MANNVTLWKKVGISMQSVIGAAIEITAITKANPAVASATGITSISDGDYVKIICQGMTQLNNRVVRVVNKTASGFELEGIDSTAYDTFTSGTLEKITFGTTFSTFLDVSASGGESTDIDTTTIHEDQSSSIPGIASASIFTFNSLWDGADAALLAAKNASDTSGQRAFMYTFANGQRYLINGYISCSLNPAGSAQEKVTTPVKISANGFSTLYAN